VEIAPLCTRSTTVDEKRARNKSHKITKENVVKGGG